MSESYHRAVGGMRARCRQADEAAREAIRRYDAATSSDELLKALRWSDTHVAPFSIYRSAAVNDELAACRDRLVARGLLRGKP